MTSLFKKVSTIALGALAALGILSALPTPCGGRGRAVRPDQPCPGFLDSWWNTIKNAIKIAGDQMNVTVEYRNPPGDAIWRTWVGLFSRRLHPTPSSLS